MSVANDLERQMLDLINDERAAAGLQPLALELRLNDSSEDHSAWMLAADVFSHTGAGGSSAGDRMKDAGFVFSGSWAWGENVAYQSERGAAGFADDVANLHQALMNSSGHRANILSPNYEVLGIGIEIGEYNGYEVVMVTQNFARSSAPMQYDSGSRPAEPPMAEPDPNTAPVVRVDDLELAAGEWRALEDLAAYSDANGDAAVRYQIKGEDVRLAGQVVDASSGIVVDAAALASLEVGGGAPGSSQSLQIRAHDGSDWGAWDGFVVAIEAEGNSAPVLAVDDFVLRPRQKVSFSEALTFSDPDGDQDLWFQVLDQQGSDNFGLGRRSIDADRGYWLTGEQLDDLWLRGDRLPSEQTLAIRAYDGEDVSDWVHFTLTTDWDATV